MNRLTLHRVLVVALAVGVLEVLCLAGVIDKGHEETAFTIGLLSVLDAAMHRPMKEVLDPLPLTDAVKAALLRREGREGVATRRTKITCTERTEGTVHGDDGGKGNGDDGGKGNGDDGGNGNGGDGENGLHTEERRNGGRTEVLSSLRNPRKPPITATVPAPRRSSPRMVR